MKKYWWVAAALVVVLAFIFYWTYDHQGETGMVAIVVQENTQSFRRQKVEECRQEVLEKANVVADSIMLMRARQRIMTQDSIIVPEKPTRPLEPRVKSKLDTAKVKPLFD